jgi:hypothetical protein
MAKEKDSPSIKDDRRGTNVTPKPEEKTGAGAEASVGMGGEAQTDSDTRRSAYGGEGGEPKLPNDRDREHLDRKS